MKKIYLTESELVGLIRNVINEQTAVNPLFNLALNRLNFSAGQNPQQILLSDRSGTVKQTLKYNVTGSYTVPLLGKKIEFGVKLRNFQRGKTKGGLWVEAQPDSWAAQTAVKHSIPEFDDEGDRNRTKDGWLINYVSPEQLQKGINQLKSNNGASAEIDAGHGVKLKLKYTGK